jgi:hypothetical protein
MQRCSADDEFVPPKVEGAIRVATYNVSLNRPEAGQLFADLSGDDEQARSVAAVIRALKPDILLLNELDWSPDTDNAQLFADKYLADPKVDELGNGAWELPNVFSAEVNTGVPSGLDLNRNGKAADPEDAWGYGRFPGQYGMAVLSRFDLARGQVHTFQRFRWAQLPNALRPQAEGEPPYYNDQTWQQLRLSSKSFWDVPVKTPLGVVHVLASHPTPPGFDGPEDRNGCRNHDEIRMLQYFIEHADFLHDDRGEVAGLSADDSFVILGDLNSDPVDGNSRSEAIIDLLSHPRVAQFDSPKSRGGVLASEKQGAANQRHRGDPAEDTGDFSDRSVGNLRVDYALPSRQFEVVGTGVFWPALDDVPAGKREAVRECMAASDHHLVWVDVRPR